jgi:hypothetical protein
LNDEARQLVEAIALNIAYMFYVSSGFTKSLLRLRIAMIFATVAFITWGLLSSTWTAVFWNVAFGAVHGYKLIELWIQHRSIQLSDSQTELRARLFSDLSTIDFYTLWSVGTSRAAEPGEVLIEEGQVQKTVMLIIDGEVAIEQGGAQVATLQADSVVGERSYLTGHRANATVRAATEATIHEWDQEKMKALQGLCPAAHDSMNRHIGLDLANKLR